MERSARLASLITICVLLADSPRVCLKNSAIRAGLDHFSWVRYAPACNPMCKNEDLTASQKVHLRRCASSFVIAAYFSVRFNPQDSRALHLELVPSALATFDEVIKTWFAQFSSDAEDPS
jgi:hypothetical protein